MHVRFRLRLAPFEISSPGFLASSASTSQHRLRRADHLIDVVPLPLTWALPI